MKAAVIHAANDLRIVELDDPVARNGEVLLHITHAGVCGSDLSYYFKGAIGEYHLTEPLIPGHELVGVVVQDGRPDGFAPGTRVTVHPATPGNQVSFLADRPNIWPESRYLGSAMTTPHQQGGMSSLFVIGADHLRVLPNQLPLRRAALAEPLAVGLHAINLVEPVKNMRILVSGAGPIGVLLAMACKVQGAEVTICDILPNAIERARALGIPHGLIVGVDDIPQESFDIVFEASGAPSAISPCLEALVRGGTMVQLGILSAGEHPVELSILTMRELTYLGSFRFNEELDQAIAVLLDHPEMEGVITHDFPIKDVVAAFECAADSQISLKVLVSL